MRFAAILPAALLLAAATLVGAPAQAQTRGSIVLVQGYGDSYGYGHQNSPNYGYGNGYAYPSNPPPGHVHEHGDPHRGSEWRERERREVQELHFRMDRAQRRIERAAQRGQISRHEAQRLNHELREARALEARMAQDGRLDRREREELGRRVDILARHIEMDLRR